MRRVCAGAGTGDIERRVGEQLLAVRRHRGFSLRELAEASSLSPTTVHQIETGRTSPGLGTLQSLAVALGVPLGALVDGYGPVSPVVHLAARDRPAIEIPAGRVEPLASGLASQRLRGLVISLTPGGSAGPGPVTHPGQELVLALEGTCLYEVGGREYRLEAGDSLLLDSNEPHHFRNPGPRLARILLVLYAPEEEPAWVGRHLPPYASGAERDTAPKSAGSPGDSVARRKKQSTKRAPSRPKGRGGER